MLVPCTDEQAGRLAAFNIGDAEIAALQRQRARVAGRMPQLFTRLDDTSAAGRQASEGLWDEKLKRLRNDYWHCIASGQLGDPFVEAATTFAKTAYANGVSGRAFTIRHSSGAQILVDGLFEKAGAAPEASWVTWIIRRQSIAKQRAQYANALQKALWMGLSILLEAYVQVEADQKRRAFQMIERSFSNQILSVADVLGAQVIALEGAVFSITASAEQSTASVDLLANDALRASAAVRDVSAATETLARSVNETGARIAQCAQSASEAADQARLGDWAVAKFADSTAAIDQVTTLIRGIADRTKLLALNASIEAVRAGDYGRGFAVVASEVSSLAKETATAINRVGQQVSLIRASAQESSAAIHALAGKIEEVSIIASVIASSVLEQGAATHAIAASVKQAALGNEQVSTLMTTMKVEAGRSLDMAGLLARAAAGIGLQGTMVRDITQTFMEDVYTAQRSDRLLAPTRRVG